eukprot:4240778-Amphidinium_carterae.1
MQAVPHISTELASATSQVCKSIALALQVRHTKSFTGLPSDSWEQVGQSMQDNFSNCKLCHAHK